MRISDWSSDVCSSDLVADLLGVLFLFGQPLLDRPADRQVAVHRVGGAGRVGDRGGTNAALDHPRQDLGGGAEQRDRLGRTGAGVLRDASKGVGEVARLLGDVTGAQAHVDAALLALDVEAAGTGETRGQRLRAAHAAEPGGQDPLALEIATVVLATHLHEGLVGALDDALAADVDPAAGGHLAVHPQALAIAYVEVLPGDRKSTRLNSSH